MRRLIFLLIGVLIGLGVARVTRETRTDASRPPAPAARVDMANVLPYFGEVALDQEYGEGGGIVRKWVRDVRLAVHGRPGAHERAELDRVVAELNELVAEISIDIVTTAARDANAEIHFVPESEFASIEENYRPRNYGFFWTRWNDRREITWARILIDTETVTPSERAHLIREELTQALGLMQDSPRYPDSIFQVDWTEVTEFSALDREVIRLLYRPDIRTGMDWDDVRAVVSP